MSQSPQIEVVQGATGSFLAVLKGDSSTGASTTLVYQGTETLEVSAGYGDTRAAAFVGAATWDDAATGSVSIVFTPTVTAAATPCVYRIYLTVTAGSVVDRHQIALLRVLPTPGATAVSGTYCSFDDVLRFAPYVMDLIGSYPDMQSDLAEHRARARSWLDDAILSAYRPEQTGDWWGFDGNTIVRSGSGWNTRGDVPPDMTMRGYLDDDMLVVRDKTKEITARMTLFYLMEPMLGGPNDKHTYHGLATYHRKMACSLLAGYVAEIDTSDPADGEPDRWVRCGVFSSR
jgi:hypothetical protein